MRFDEIPSRLPPIEEFRPGQTYTFTGVPKPPDQVRYRVQADLEQQLARSGLKVTTTYAENIGGEATIQIREE